MFHGDWWAILVFLSGILTLDVGGRSGDGEKGNGSNGELHFDDWFVERE